MTDRKAKQRRLERAGYVYVAGWLRADGIIFADPEGYVFAQDVREAIEDQSYDVAAILAEPPKPRGRPRKVA